MKFLTDLDAHMFLVEVSRPDLIQAATKDFVPSPDLMEAFIKGRRGVMGAMKDFRRRQTTKQQWRQNRWEIMRGIKRFHKSTAGKKFHRSLGRYLATRDFETKRSTLRTDETFDPTEVADVLRAISSLETHLFIELEYFRPMTEELEWQMFMTELLPMLERMKKNLLSGSYELEPEDEEFLARVVFRGELIRGIAEVAGVPYQEVEAAWEKVDSGLDACGVTEENDAYARNLLESIRQIFPHP